jgi:hypothetical protein
MRRLPWSGRQNMETIGIATLLSRIPLRIHSMGYARGHGMGEAEANQRDFLKCSEKLAYFAVEAGNVKVAGKHLVEGDFAPSQLQAAEAKYNQKRPR